jgi:hypothetical protein
MILTVTVQARSDDGKVTTKAKVMRHQLPDLPRVGECHQLLGAGDVAPVIADYRRRLTPKDIAAAAIEERKAT